MTTITEYQRTNLIFRNTSRARNTAIYTDVVKQLKVVWYPKMDQNVCLNMVKKYQLCGIALKRRN